MYERKYLYLRVRNFGPPPKDQKKRDPSKGLAFVVTGDPDRISRLCQFAPGL